MVRQQIQVHLVLSLNQNPSQNLNPSLNRNLNQNLSLNGKILALRKKIAEIKIERTDKAVKLLALVAVVDVCLDLLQTNRGSVLSK
jgi:hypothetical protein